MRGQRPKPSTPDAGLVPPHGGYRKLKSFQLAELCFDVTVRFAERYVAKYSRTKDQMVQAARSATQNIVEGSQASGTSKKTELKLTNVARASLEELRRDYEDYLRQHALPQWRRDDPRRGDLIAARCATVEAVAAWIRKEHGRSRLGGQSGRSTPSTTSTPSTYPAIAANAALVLIAVASALLDRQITALARSFVEKGGFTERMHRIRTEHRRRDLSRPDRQLD
jgi:four helix bundle suffix protein